MQSSPQPRVSNAQAIATELTARSITKSVIPVASTTFWQYSINLLSLLILIPVTSRNILLLPSLPNSIPYRQDNERRRKDEQCVGTATRGSLARLSRLP